MSRPTSAGPSPVVSLLLCTRDHARALEPTLRALAEMDLPGDLPAELVLIDNGSTDDTARTAERCAREALEPRGFAYRYVHEPRPGQCHARNAGLDAARGAIILCTDDDVRPSRNWLAGMCRPILEGTAEAVVGRVSLAPHLERPWMLPTHRAWLAGTDILKDGPLRLVGASMAFAARVREKVPYFDAELGPGALGFGDDTLFGQQLERAGYRIAAAFDTCIEHHPDADRLLRRSYLAAAAKHGRSGAYVAHHWHHVEIPQARLRAVKNRLVLALLRQTRVSAPQRRPDAEGIGEWEMQQTFHASYYAQYVLERRRPRRYERFGLAVRQGRKQ